MSTHSKVHEGLIWTDVAQLILYIAGSAITFFFLLHRIPAAGAKSRKSRRVRPQTSLFDFLSRSPQNIRSGPGSSAALSHHGQPRTDQTIVQRLLADKNERDSRAALIASGFIVLFQFMLFYLSAFYSSFFRNTLRFSPPAKSPTPFSPPSWLKKCPPASRESCSPRSSPSPCPTPAARSTLSPRAPSSISPVSAASKPTQQISQTFARITLLWGLVLLGFGLKKWGPFLETGLSLASLPFGSLLGLFFLARR